MRALLVVSWWALAASGAAQESPALRLCVESEGPALRDEVGLRLIGWDVRVAAPPEGEDPAAREVFVRATKAEHEAVAWVESDGRVSRLVMVPSEPGALRASPLPPRATPGWERVVALVLEGLLDGERLSGASLAAPAGQARTHTSADSNGTSADPTGPPANPAAPTSTPATPTGSAPGSAAATRAGATSRWPSPLARNGWMLRVGWLVSASPRQLNGFGAYARDATTWAEINGGLRLRAGRWLTRFLRVDASAHVAKTWFDIGMEGGLDVELMAVSSTRFRMGGGVGFGVLMASERDAGTGNLFGWTGWWASLPMEVGFDFYRRSGMFIHIGPTWTKAPYAARPGPGFMMSVEAELDLGTHR